MFFTRDAYVVCTLVILAGEVCVSLVSEAAVLCVSFPGRQELLLKCSPRPVLLLLCLMGCWRAEAKLAHSAQAAGGWAGNPTPNPVWLQALLDSLQWSSALGLLTKNVHHFNDDLKCFVFNLAMLFFVKF